jgi:hypothetical protein
MRNAGLLTFLVITLIVARLSGKTIHARTVPRIGMSEDDMKCMISRPAIHSRLSDVRMKYEWLSGNKKRQRKICVYVRSGRVQMVRVIRLRKDLPLS